MEVRISAKQIDLTPPIEEYVRRKLEKLPRYFDAILSVEAHIDKDGPEFTFETILAVGHHEPIVANGRHEDLYACIDQGVDRAIRQLHDHKSKLRDNKHHTSTGGKPA